MEQLAAGIQSEWLPPFHQQIQNNLASFRLLGQIPIPTFLKGIYWNPYRLMRDLHFIRNVNQSVQINKNKNGKCESKSTFLYLKNLVRCAHHTVFTHQPPLSCYRY